MSEERAQRLAEMLVIAEANLIVAREHMRLAMAEIRVLYPLPPPLDASDS